MKTLLLSLLLTASVLMVVTKADAQTYYISTIAGDDSAAFKGDSGQATLAYLNNPQNTAIDKFGNVYIADWGNNRVRKVDINGIITTFAGTGVLGNTGDGGLATAAQLNRPGGVAVDDTGNVYICCTGSQSPFKAAGTIRKINTSGIITLFAGNNSVGFGGDGGPATSATMGFPRSVAIDDSNNIYIADYGNNCVRKVNRNGIINTIAGIGGGFGTAGYTGNGGPATSAKLSGPAQVAIDDSGNIFIADYGNNVVRKVNNKGIISTYAGTGTAGYAGEGVPALQAQLNNILGIAVDKGGNLFIASPADNHVRKIDKNGVINTIAGTGVGGHTGDGGPALAAELFGPIGVSVDTLGNVYVAEHNRNSDIRKLTPGCRSSLTVTSSIAPPICKGKSITLTATGSSSYQWVGTTNVTGTITISPVADTTLELIAGSGNCSKDTIISIGVAPDVILSTSPTSASFCSGNGIRLTATGGTTYNWAPAAGLSVTTGNTVIANPSTSTTYTVTANSSAGCTAIANDTIAIKPTPTAAFTDSVIDKQVLFNSDKSSGGVSAYSWDFGDGSSLNTDANPTHTYASKDTFYVCLTVYNNSNCSYTLCKNVDLLDNSVKNITAQLSLQLYPNPVNSQLNINGSGLPGSEMAVTDLLGRTLLSQKAVANETIITVGTLPTGVYLLEVKSKQGIGILKFIKN